VGLGLGLRVWGSAFRAYGLWRRVQTKRVGVQGLGFAVSGLGSGVVTKYGVFYAHTAGLETLTAVLEPPTLGLIHNCCGVGHTNCGVGHTQCGGRHTKCGGRHTDCGVGHTDCGAGHTNGRGRHTWGDMVSLMKEILGAPSHPKR